ncbi:hypothetical protein BX600DRAFT_455328 [Xylariales sp. PMI_506]|nr:hypothetical protein BX600DRAFT_455328 [Xylariales sp. PMI_506]
MARGSRQYAPKTRNGCGQCKKRHVRCNLEPPICANCRRRNEPCDYMTFVGEEASQPNGEGVVARRIGQASALPWVGVPSPMNYLQAQPPSHIRPPSYNTFWNFQETFNLNTDPVTWLLDKIWLVPCSSPAEEAQWRVQLASHAKTYKYLNPSLSSLIALHQSLQESKPDANFRASAYHYNIQASNLFRISGATVTEENWLAVMVFVFGVMVFQFGAAATIPAHEYDRLKILRLVRRTAEVAALAKPYFDKSKLRAFVEYRHSLVKKDLDQEAWLAVQQLREIEFPPDISQHSQIACCQAVAALVLWVESNASYPTSWLEFLVWPSSISNQFIELLESKNQIALVTFVYWCAIMHRAPQRWFTGAWTRRDAIAAMADLDPSWDNLLIWPRKTLGITFPTL